MRHSPPYRRQFRAKSNSGAPRSMKMGTIPSLWPYDAAARDALQSANLRRPAILYCASWGSCLPDFAGWSGYPSMAALSINPGIDVMGQKPTSAFAGGPLSFKSSRILLSASPEGACQFSDILQFFEVTNE